MSNPITALTQVKPVQEQAPAPAANPKPSNPTSGPTPAYTVNISNSAKAILQELTETRSQTGLEANAGDSQARRLLARETAANPTHKG